MKRFGDLIGSKPMASNVQMSSCKGLIFSGQIASRNVLLRLDPKSLNINISIPVKRSLTSTRASNSDSNTESVPLQKNKIKKKNAVEIMLDLPRNVWRQTMKPLSNFGFGKNSVGEGGAGLFMMAGAVLLAFTIVWLKGFQLRSRSKKYQAVIEFSQAPGLTVGTPVRIRGFTVGSVVKVRPSLEKIDATIQLVDDRVVIPRNSIVEVNQSGLITETLIDITPRHPIPATMAGPLDPDCNKEGLIVCDRQRIKGERGVSLDELLGICIRLGRQLDDISIIKAYDLAERIGLVIEEAKPILAKIEALTGDFQPLLKEFREGGLLKEIEHLTKDLAGASEDLRKLNSSILTPENTDLLRQSVSTLIMTLKNIESISGDISDMTGDAATRHNLKQLIDSLSKLIID